MQNKDTVVQRGVDVDTWVLSQESTDKGFREAADFLNQEYGNPQIGLKWSRDLFSWKIGALNSAGSGLLICARLKGVVVGSVSLTVKRLRYRGAEYKVAEIGDAFTGKALLTRSAYWKYKCASEYHGAFDKSEYLNSSIFGRLAAEAVDRAASLGVVAIYGTANPHSLTALTKRLGFRLLDKNRISSRVLLTANLISWKFTFLRTAESLLGLAISVASTILLAIPMIRLRNCEIVELQEPAGDEFDALWSSGAHGSIDASVIKDKNWILWRYQTHPDSEYKIFTLRMHEKLVAWIVLKIHCGQDGQRTIFVCDWLFHGASRQFSAFMLLVLKAEHYQRAIVKFWSRDDTQLMHGMFSLFPLRVRSVNLIFRCVTNTDKEFLENVMFEELHLGDSDNV